MAGERCTKLMGYTAKKSNTNAHINVRKPEIKQAIITRSSLTRTHARARAHAHAQAHAHTHHASCKQA
eukprot:5656714-Amphidinium_carterae.1